MTFRSCPALLAGLLLSVSAGAMTAQAADVAVPASDLWNGFYVGAQAGYLQGSYSNSDLCQNITGEGRICLGDMENNFNIGDSSPDGVTAGGYVGYNYRIESVVLGLEGDWNWDNGQDSKSLLGELSYDTSLNWDAAIRARLGYVVDERALLYVTGGPSWLNTELSTSFNINVNAPAPNVKKGDSSTEFGWVLGAGAEYAITEHLSVKAEYLHGWYGDADLDILSGTSGGETEKIYIKQDLQTNLVRAGVAYHFGGL